tara:strand:- start:2337 stop:2585 length:249 start_codon:yes stop_codon:yes gene_type:complete
MFYNAQKGKFDEWEINNQNEWERARWLASVIINPHVKKNIQPKDITRFEWEKKKKIKSSEEIEKLQNEALLYKKINESNNKK